MRRRGEQGYSLLELAISLSVLTVGLLAFVMSLGESARGNRSVLDEDEATFAFAQVIETLRGTNFVDLYNNFDGQDFPAGSLQQEGGTQANIRVNFFVDETNLPAEFGPLADLDGDGALTNANVSGSYQILPAQLTLNYEGPRGNHSRTFWLVLGNR